MIRLSTMVTGILLLSNTVMAQSSLTMPELLRRLQPQLATIPEADRKLITSLIRPTIGYQEKLIADDSVAVGHSKIGGRPDLPVDFDWPAYNGKPMAFCVQYNLADAAPFDTDHLLPKQGLLSVFIAIDEQCPCFYEQGNTFQLVYSPDTASLKRTDFPANYFQDGIFRSARISFFQYYTLPGSEDARLSTFSQQRRNTFFKIKEVMHEIGDTASGMHLPGPPQFPTHNYHQLLGYDRPIQGSVLSNIAWDLLNLRPLAKNKERVEASRDQIAAIERDYIILLQLDCASSQHNDLDKYGGDCVIYFAIKSDDLKNHRFDRVILVFQCT